MVNKEELLQTLARYQKVGITEQLDFDKFNLLSLIAHSAAMEGSTLSEIECLLLFDEGIPAKGKDEKEQRMAMDLKAAYEYALPLALNHTDWSVDLLKTLSAMVMKNTGQVFTAPAGNFDAAQGELRRLNVTAGVGGCSYMNYELIASALDDFCSQMNARRRWLLKEGEVYENYLQSFDACFLLESIHPWGEGNGRMARMMMNLLQYELGVTPSKVMREDKAAYLEALMAARNQGDLEDFRNFMLEEHICNLKNDIDKYLIDNRLNLIDAYFEPQEKQDGPQRNIKDGLQKTTNEPQKKTCEPQEKISEPQNKKGELQERSVPNCNEPQEARLSEPQEGSVEETILHAIAENNKITREELAEITGTSVSTVKRRLKNMAHLVEFVGSGYSGHWEVK